MVQESLRAQFGELRSLLHQGHHEKVWAQLCRLLDTWEHHPELEPIALPYIQGQLRRWPDELRTAPAPWLERQLEQHSPAPIFPQWEVVRAIDCHGQMFGHMTWRRLGRDFIGGQIRTLRARSLPLTHRELGLVLEPKSILELKHLDLTYCTLTQEALEVLVTHPHLQNLRRLDAGECRLGHMGVQLICISPYLNNLESLKLQNDRLGMGVLDALLRAEFAPKLKTLDLSDNHLGPRGAAILGQPHVWQHLEQLRLKNCGLGPDGVRALFSHPKAFPKLRSLNLERNDILNWGLKWLVESPVIEHLQSLNVGYNKISGDGLKWLLHDPRAKNLKRLAVHWNPISPTAHEVLAASPYIDADDFTLLR